MYSNMRAIAAGFLNYVLKHSSSRNSKDIVSYMYFLDFGGGSYPEVISSAQSEWFSCRSHEINPENRVPEIVFWHIPSDVYQKLGKKKCVGSLFEEVVAPQIAEMGIMKLLEKRPSVKLLMLLQRNTKSQIAKEFHIPLYVRHVFNSNAPKKTSELPVSSRKDDACVSPLHFRTVAMALLHHRQTMPSTCQEELTQIVMKYYRGREIREQHLEEALLVGMTPLERRRFMEKRGLPVISNAENKDSSIAFKNDIAAKKEKNVSSAQDVGISGTNLQFGGGVESAVCRTETYNNVVDLIPPNNFPESVDSKNGNLSNKPRNKIALAKHNSKFSLLGHGPHGKQVVDYLLKEHDKEGNRESCQRWRQIFVASLYPIFLPAGWDVNHMI